MVSLSPPPPPVVHAFIQLPVTYVSTLFSEIPTSITFTTITVNKNLNIHTSLFSMQWWSSPTCTSLTGLTAKKEPLPQRWVLSRTLDGSTAARWYIHLPHFVSGGAAGIGLNIGALALWTLPGNIITSVSALLTGLTGAAIDKEISAEKQCDTLISFPFFSMYSYGCSALDESF